MSLTQAELTQLQQQLQFLQARLRGDVQDIASSAFGGEQGESRSPTHLAELGSENFEQDFALDLIRNEQDTLSEIALALAKFSRGTFGLCEGCLAEGVPEKKAVIPKARLKAIPWARNCVECERKRETHIR